MYAKPEMFVEEFDVEDVITASSGSMGTGMSPGAEAGATGANGESGDSNGGNPLFPPFGPGSFPSPLG